MIRTAAALLVLLSIPNGGALAAEDGPTGVAIVASPEMGSGFCFETTPEKGFACARKKCEAFAGEQADQCTPVRWCLPARFGADVVVNDREGFTYHEYLCDEADEAALRKAAAAICEEAVAQSANGCDVAGAWDADGRDIALALDPEPAAAK